MQKIPATLLLAFLTSCATMEERIVENNIKNIEECDRFYESGYLELLYDSSQDRHRDYNECKEHFIKKQKIEEKINDDRDLNLIKEFEKEMKEAWLIKNSRISKIQIKIITEGAASDIFILEDWIMWNKGEKSAFGNVYKAFQANHKISDEKMFDLLIKKTADNWENEFTSYKKLSAHLKTSNLRHKKLLTRVTEAINERSIKLSEQELSEDSPVNNKAVSQNEANIHKINKVLSQIIDWNKDSERRIVAKFANTIAKKYKESPFFTEGVVIQVLNNNKLLVSVDNGSYGFQTIAVQINKKFADGDVFEFALIKSGRMRYVNTRGSTSTVNSYIDINFEIEKFEKLNKSEISFLDIRDTIRNSSE